MIKKYTLIGVIFATGTILGQPPSALDPKKAQLWVTLFNILDDGTVTMLIPRPTNTTSALNIAAETGQRYQIPRQQLKKGENAL